MSTTATPTQPPPVPEPPFAPLTNAQRAVLCLLNVELSEAELNDLKRTIVRILSHRLDETLARWEEENGITAEDYERMSHEHHRRPADRP